MTSRFALLTAIAGTIGLSCSGGDSNSGPPPAPTVAPNFVNNPSSNMPAANTSQNNQAPVAPTNTNTNTEQMAPVTPPPTTNNQTAAGTGGTGGGSTPPPTTGSTIPTGTGNAITPTAGHVAGTSNGVGIQGDFYTFSDADGTPPGATTITPKDFSMAMGTQICASGSASQIMNGTDGTPAYGQYYGGGIGFNLGDPGGGAGAQPWPQGKVVGFSFNLSGTTIPANMRFQAKFYSGSTLDTGDAYCTSTVKMGANTVMFSSLLLDCYNATPGAPLPTTVLLQSIQWQVVTGVMAATPFNFCVDSLTAITSP